MSRTGIRSLTDSGLLAWSSNFSTRITATPTAFNLTSALASAYATIQSSWASALLACDPNVRSKSAVIHKDEVRVQLCDQATLLINQVNAGPNVTNSQKTDLGIHIRKAPSPIGPPSTQPAILIDKVTGNIVELLLRGSQANKRAKPAGVASAVVMSWLGETPNPDFTKWTLEGTTSRNKLAVQFPISAEPFSKVWFTAFWQSPSGAPGVACTPVSTNLGTWMVQSVEGGGTSVTTPTATLKAA